MSEFPHHLTVDWPFKLGVWHSQELDIQLLGDGTWEIRAYPRCGYCHRQPPCTPDSSWRDCPGFAALVTPPLPDGWEDANAV